MSKLIIAVLAATLCLSALAQNDPLIEGIGLPNSDLNLDDPEQFFLNLEAEIKAIEAQELRAQQQQQARQEADRKRTLALQEQERQRKAQAEKKRAALVDQKIVGTWVHTGGAGEFVFQSNGKMKQIARNGPITTTYYMNYTFDGKTNRLSYDIYNVETQGAGGRTPNIQRGKTFTQTVAWQGNTLIVGSARYEKW